MVESLGAPVTLQLQQVEVAGLWWCLAAVHAGLDFGAVSHDLLIGQFAGGGTTQGSGTIAIYDLVTGQFKGLLQDASGNTIAINGLWDISPGNNSSVGSYDPAGSPGSELYFTAGPNNGTGGLFGYLKPVATDLTEGNDQ